MIHESLLDWHDDEAELPRPAFRRLFEMTGNMPLILLGWLMIDKIGATSRLGLTHSLRTSGLRPFFDLESNV